MGKYVADKVAKLVAKNPTIELIHVFSHAGDTPSHECDVGTFSNRGASSRYFWISFIGASFCEH